MVEAISSSRVFYKLIFMGGKMHNTRSMQFLKRLYFYRKLKRGLAIFIQIYLLFQINPSILFAEVIVSKRGGQIEVKILERTDEHVKAIVNDVPIIISRDEIKEIKESNPYFEDIFNVIKNYHQHRYDIDKTQCLNSISKKYKVQKNNGKILDYDGFASVLKERTEEYILIFLDNLMIADLKITGNSASCIVLFSRTKKKLEDEAIVIQDKYMRFVTLEKEEEGWKITAIRRMNEITRVDRGED